MQEETGQGEHGIRFRSGFPLLNLIIVCTEHHALSCCTSPCSLSPFPSNMVFYVNSAMSKVRHVRTVYLES